MPATRAGSMALGVFGDLDADESIYARDDDCYSAFHGLSSVMGHLSSANADDPDTGWWGMNDAGGPWLGSDPRGCRAEFQVAPTRPGHPLPIEAFTWTAVAALERFGPVTLHGLEYYLPLELPRPAFWHVRSGAAWFAPAAPEARTRVAITIDSGESPFAVRQREDIVPALEYVAPKEEGIDPALITQDRHVDFDDPVPWRWWLGDGEPHLNTLHATITEWTALGVGRIVALIVEACLTIGHHEPIGVRVARVA